MIDLAAVEHLSLRGGAERVAQLDRSRSVVPLHREIAPVAQPHAIGDGAARAAADRRRAGGAVALLHYGPRIAVGARLRGVLALLPAKPGILARVPIVLPLPAAEPVEEALRAGRRLLGYERESDADDLTREAGSHGLLPTRTVWCMLDYLRAADALVPGSGSVAPTAVSLAIRQPTRLTLARESRRPLKRFLVKNTATKRKRGRSRPTRSSSAWRRACR